MFFAAGTSTLAGVTALLSSVPAAFSTFSSSDAATVTASPSPCSSASSSPFDGARS